ncbi:MAG: hypothetical protein F4X02_06405 [Chloroflexi bacterium]|nr:hypothetical protein [Chloroflexota bacterium]
MPITVDWNDRARAFIKCEFSDPWSLDQFIEARKTWYRMIKSADHHVPIVLDMRETYEAPAGALRHFSAIHRTPHPRQGQLYVLGLNPPYRQLAPYIFRCQDGAEHSVRLVDSIECVSLAP